jgi:hypothetical protein
VNAAMDFRLGDCFASQEGLCTMTLVRGMVCDSPCDVQLHSMEPAKWMRESRRRGV